MFLEDVLKDEKKYEKHIKEIEIKLDKYDILNVSSFLIKSHIKSLWDESCNKKDNYKIIVKNIISERILRRRKQILVHSCIYYKFNESLIQDFEYDNLCKELAELQERFPNISEKTALYKTFENWIYGETSGYDLPFENPKVVEMAQKTIERNKWYKENG